MRSFQQSWMSLPDLVLVEVFKYLPDCERANAALVCQSWYRAFKSPCLWRTRSFEMGGYKAQIYGERACKFATSFGQYLRYLAISCSHPSYHTCKLFQKTIDDFLVTLKEADAQLVDFELCRLELERYWKYDTHRDKLVSIFSKFLKTQRRLQCFDMSSAQFPAFGGCRVLDAIGHHSGSTLQDLMIEDFFHSRLSLYNVKKFHKVITKFTNLQYLAINYNCLSDEVLEIFSKSLQRKLHFLNIKVFRNDPHFHRISGYAWKQFTLACPCLRVAYWFESVGMHNEIAPILAREAPVKDIHLWSGYDDDSDWRLSETIDHIADSYTNMIDLRMLHVTFCGVAGQLITEDQLAHIRIHYSELLMELGVHFRLHRFDY
ncbi:F-box only protein 39 [Mactra antiquata]